MKQGNSYSKQRIYIHWAAVLLIICMIITGLSMEESPQDEARIFNLQIHTILGVIVSLLSIYRLIHHQREKRQGLIPASTPSPSKLRRNMRSFVHLALRNMMIGLGITGFIALFLSSLFPIIIENDSSLFTQYTPGGVNTAHAILSKIYMLLFFLHVVGIIETSLKTKTNLLSRMYIGSNR